MSVPEANMVDGRWWMEHPRSKPRLRPGIPWWNTCTSHELSWWRIGNIAVRTIPDGKCAMKTGNVWNLFDKQLLVHGIWNGRKWQLKLCLGSMVMQLVFDVHNVASRFWSQSLPSRTNAQLFVWHAALVEKVWSISRCPVCNLLVRQSWNLHFEPYKLDNDNVYIYNI